MLAPRPTARVLIAPLNWGLGHATRCLPLAGALEAAATVAGLTLELHWASDGNALALLRRERPNDAHHELPSYGVRYPTRWPVLNMALAGPRIFKAIGAEAGAVQPLHANHHFDLILSDNRYGCRLPGVRSLLISHQLHLPITGLAGRVAQVLANVWVQGFDEVVVPDHAQAPRLAGAMSAPLPRMPVRYVGPVSRFAATPTQFEPASEFGRGSAGRSPELVLCLLSGPEPTRAEFESALYQQLPSALEEVFGSRDSHVTLVRGTQTRRTNVPVRSRNANAEPWTIEDLLTSGDVGQVLAKADLLICRPGYTTVMDLAALGRRALVVPTPGQPEQEWLGRSLSEQGRGVCVAQAAIGRPGVLAKALLELRALNADGRRLSPKPSGTPLTSWATEEISRLAQITVNTV